MHGSCDSSALESSVTFLTIHVSVICIPSPYCLNSSPVHSDLHSSFLDSVLSVSSALPPLSMNRHWSVLSIFSKNLLCSHWFFSAVLYFIDFPFFCLPWVLLCSYFLSLPCFLFSFWCDNRFFKNVHFVLFGPLSTRIP